MADEPTQPPVEEAPVQDQAASAPQEGTSAEESTFAQNFDPNSLSPELQTAYRQMQSDYTRKTQELSTQRQEQNQALQAWEMLQNPETAPEVLATLGFDVEYPDEQYVDPETYAEQEPQYFDPRVDDMLAKQQEQEALQTVNAVVGHIDQLAQEKGLNLTDRQRQAILNEAVDSGNPNPDQTAQIMDAWATDLNGYRDQVIKDYRDSKKGAPSPPVPSGDSGTSPVPVSDRNQRLALMNQIAEEAQASHGQ